MKTARRADAVERSNPIRERIEGRVLDLGSLSQRVQPQTRKTGAARNPTTIKTPKATCMNVIKVKAPLSRVLYAGVSLLTR